MNMTFGICTSFEDPTRLRDVISSIEGMSGINSPKIIVAGPEFGAWLPEKKNAIAKNASGDILVLLHDYFLFDKYWYKSYCKFGDEWDICSTPQFLLNGKRHFTDWVVWDSSVYPRYTSLKYTDWSHTQSQYISGGFFVVKKEFLLNNPLNEELSPGDPEDVEWSLRVRDIAKIVCNPNTFVIHNKMHRDCGRVGFPFFQEIHQGALDSIIRNIGGNI